MYVNANRNDSEVIQERFTVDPENCPDRGIPFGNNIVVIIPAYNEERFIGSVVIKAKRYARTVIVVDDGSKDDTAQIAYAAGAMVLQHKSNLGKGAALNTGFEMARLYNPDVTVMIDADGQHLPCEIDAVIAPVLEGKADLVIGSRYLNHACQVPYNRILGHRVINLFTRLASGEAASDSQSGFRAFSRNALQWIEFKSRGFSVESEMQFLAHEFGLKLVEVPVTIRYLDDSKRPALSQGLAVLTGILRLIGQYRPLAYFGFTGLFVLTGGLFCGIRVVERFQSIHELAIGTALIGSLLIIIGSLLISTGFILYSVRGLLIDLMRHRPEGSI